MSSSIDTEQRFIDLEIKIGFMEDLLDNLNTLVARQQQHIDLLVKDRRRAGHLPPQARGQSDYQQGNQQAAQHHRTVWAGRPCESSAACT